MPKNLPLGQTHLKKPIVYQKYLLPLQRFTVEIFANSFAIIWLTIKNLEINRFINEIIYQKMTKRIFKLRNVVAIAICLAGMTMFSGCSKDDKKDNGNPEPGTKLKTREELIPLIPNFSYTAQESLGLAHLVICEAGFAYDRGGYEDPGYNNWAYCDYAAKKLYDLFPQYAERPIGFITNLTDEAVERAKVEIYDIAGNMFRHEQFINYDMVVIGKEKVAGRNTTIYRDGEQGGIVTNFWIDDEIGVTLKWNTTVYGGAEWKILEIKFGGCHMSDWVNLSDYIFAK